MSYFYNDFSLLCFLCSLIWELLLFQVLGLLYWSSNILSFLKKKKNFRLSFCPVFCEISTLDLPNLLLNFYISYSMFNYFKVLTWFLLSGLLLLLHVYSIFSDFFEDSSDRFLQVVFCFFLCSSHMLCFLLAPLSVIFYSFLHWRLFSNTQQYSGSPLIFGRRLWGANAITVCRRGLLMGSLPCRITTRQQGGLPITG